MWSSSANVFGYNNRAEYEQTRFDTSLMARALRIRNQLSVPTTAHARAAFSFAASGACLDEVVADWGERVCVAADHYPPSPTVTSIWQIGVFAQESGADASRAL